MEWIDGIRCTDPRQAFRDELDVLQLIRHPNVVHFLGAVTQSSPMMIVMEYMPKGNLRKRLSRKGALEPSYAVKLALDVARIEAACNAHPTADVFINFASFRSAAASSMSALMQPTIRVVAIISEGVPESDTKQLISYARANNKVKMMAVLGELGGKDEYSLTEALKQGKVQKPVVACVSGTCAHLFKSEVQFGHADLFKVWNDPQRGAVTLELISFKRATGQKPQRIIFYRDGVSEGRLY
ncbi:hypothetical protein ABZP36_011537 [Zizania latifolia]